MDKSNGRQVFDYILSSNLSEQLQSYQNVFIRLKQCTLPQPDNLFFIYYVIQNLYQNLQSVWVNMNDFLINNNINPNPYLLQYQNTLKFLDKIYKSKINNMPKETVNYDKPTANHFVLAPYTQETFLSLPIVKAYIKEPVNQSPDISDYKEIIDLVLTDTSIYRLSPEDKKYYITNFNQLLKTNTLYMKNNTANKPTFNTLAYIIFSQDSIELDSNPQQCPAKNKYMSLYHDIINLLNF
tara:strand:- start:441 stop:1157 length:717 start_codon:yes stop_codon:yes gene_type:complete